MEDVFPDVPRHNLGNQDDDSLVLLSTARHDKLDQRLGYGVVRRRELDQLDSGLPMIPLIPQLIAGIVLEVNADRDDVVPSRRGTASRRCTPSRRRSASRDGAASRRRSSASSTRAARCRAGRLCPLTLISPIVSLG